MINSRYQLLLLILFVGIAWIACTQQKDPCLQPTTIPLRIGTYKPADTGSLGIDYTLPAARIRLIDTNYGFAEGYNTNKFTVLLSPIADSCRYYIQPDTADHITPADTLVMYYQRQLHFLSGSCGYTYFYSLNHITTTNYSIDSVRINSADVTSDVSKEHVKIFY